MAKKEVFVRRVYEVVNELKIPLIDERVYDKIGINESRALIDVTFKFEDDEGVIRGFLGLAEYFHSVVLKQKDTFLIPSNTALFRLVCA